MSNLLRLSCIFLIAVFVLLVSNCTLNNITYPQNKAPIIRSSHIITAEEDIPFCYIPVFGDPDGPDTIISFLNTPSWLIADGDSLYGIPIEGFEDTSFIVMISDGILADTQIIFIAIKSINDGPVINSDNQVEASGGIYFSYTATANDPDDPLIYKEYNSYPDWLTSNGNSVFGIPPDGLGDTNFVVICSDSSLSDTMLVEIKMIPCMIFYGDTRTGHDAHRAIVSRIRENRSPVVFHVGDLVNNGTSQSDWDIFNGITSEMIAESEFYPALGNHENQSQLFFDNFELPNNEQWYSVDRSYSHVIILNTCVEIDSGSAQYQWLEQDLALIDDSIRFIAIVFHHPPYSTGSHTEDKKHLRESIVPLFEEYGVDVVFTGHDHSYERSYCGGGYYIVTGGGGAPIRSQARDHPCSQLYLMKYHYCKVSIVEETLYARVFDIDGLLIDQFDIAMNK